ncbi:MAG: hypothetical protein ACAH88_07610, partial [Roseimicrobium sp.]
MNLISRPSPWVRGLMGAAVLASLCIHGAAHAQKAQNAPKKKKGETYEQATPIDDVYEKLLHALQTGGELNLRDKKVFPNGTTVDSWVITNLIAEAKKLGIMSIWISGATVQGEVAFYEWPEDMKLSFTNCDFKHCFNIENLPIKGLIQFNDCKIAMVCASGARLTGWLGMEKCEITGQVNFGNAKIAGDLSFYDCDFKGKHPVWLSGLQVEGSLTLDGSDFAPPLMARMLKAENFNGVGASFGGGADISHAVIENDVVFDDCKSAGPLTFHGGRIGGSVELTGAELKDTLSLQLCRIGGSLALDNGSFDGSVYGQGLDVADACALSHSSFRGADDACDFTRSKIGDLYFFNASFFSVVSFNRAQIKGELQGYGSEFLTGRAAADFQDMSVGETCNLTQCRFYGQVTLQGAKVGTLWLGKSRFEKLGKLAIRWSGETEAWRHGFMANGLQVEKHLGLDDCYFGNNVTLSRAQVGGDIFMTRAIMCAPKGGLALNGIEVGGNLDMENTRIIGNIDAHEASIGGKLMLGGGRFGGRFQNQFGDGACYLDFSSAKCKSLAAGSAHFAGATSFDSVLVEVGVYFGGSTFGPEELFGESKPAYGYSGKSAYKGGIDFSGMSTVQGSIDFTRCKFTGPTMMRRMSTKGNFVIEDCRFTGERLHMTNLQVEENFSGSGARFRDCEFRMQLSSIKGMFTLNECRFMSEKHPVQLAAVKVGGQTQLVGALSLSSVEFFKCELGAGLVCHDGAGLKPAFHGCGVFSLQDCLIGGNVMMQNVLIEGNAVDSGIKDCNFSGTRFQGQLYLAESDWRSPIVFSNSSVDGTFSLHGASIGKISGSDDALFGLGLRCAGGFNAGNAVFRGGLRLLECSFTSGIVLNGSKFTGSGDSLDLSGGTVTGGLHLRDATIPNWVNLS